MDNKEIIEYFFNKGHLVSPEFLEQVKDKDIKEIETSDEIVLQKIKQPRIRVIKNLTSKPGEITTEDFVGFYQSKYNKMKKIFTDRLQKEFVSLNKLGKDRKEVHIFGIVKNISKNEKTILTLEDMTGSVSVELPTKETDIEIDDCIVVRGITAGDYFFGKEILYPDIPLRSPTTGEEKVCFISDLHLNESPESEFKKFLNWFETQNIEYLFVAGDIGDEERFKELVKNIGAKIFVVPGNVDDNSYPSLAFDIKESNIVTLSNPAMVEINGVKILIIHKFEISMLRKRYLGKSKTILTDDYLVLDEIPDIVHYGHTHTPDVRNYKSTTIVNSGSILSDFNPVVIDLADRTTKQEVVK